MQLPGLNFGLGEDLEALRDSVHAFAQRLQVLAEAEVQAG